MARLRVIFLLITIFFTTAISAQIEEQDDNTPPPTDVDLNNPVFVPMIKVGKVLHGKDSIQYIQMNNVYVYPQPVFENEKQREAYNRLVLNVKKVLPIAKEVNKIIIETYEYLQTNISKLCLIKRRKMPI